MKEMKRMKRMQIMQVCTNQTYNAKCRTL